MSQALSACQYLYGRPAAQIFNRRQLSEAVVDQCLEILMRIHVYLFSNKDPFFLIQPTGYNDQCHLYSLRALQIMRVYRNKTDTEKHARNDDNKFLHLSLFLSFAFIINPHFYIKVVKRGLTDLKKESGDLTKLPTRKALSIFLEELYSSEPKKAARLAYNEVFITYAHSTVQRLKDRDGAMALDQELFNLFTTENLYLSPRIGEGDSTKAGKELRLYTPPKFAGVTLLYKIMELEQIPFAIKVMVITPQGTGIHSLVSRPVQEHEPVLIFETFATDGILSLQECRKVAMQCPNYHRKNPTFSSHVEATCLFCNPTQIDVTPYHDRLSTALLNPQRLFYALGADYILSTPGQAKYRTFFEDTEHYPRLTAHFQESIQAIESLGVSEKKPITLSVSFVYADNGAYAMGRKMFSNHSCRDHLNERGLFHQVKTGAKK